MRSLALAVGVSVALLQPAHAVSAVPYTTEYFEQDVDHFTYGGVNVDPATPNPTWKQRYLQNNASWDGRGRLENGCKGPILFYTGNEGPITAFWDVAGFVNHDLAEEWGALVIFAEHRYYGESMPFGNASMTKQNVQYCTAEQALADYAKLLLTIKKDLNAEHCPIISFGGSYGGTLSTYFRLKYPHVVSGALAASAPIGYYDPAAWEREGLSNYTWIDIVNKVYHDGGCLEELISARDLITNTAATAEGRTSLKTSLNLCEVPPTQKAAVDLFTDAVENLPQMNYPYAIGQFPAWPVNSTCTLFKKNNNSLLTAVSTLQAWYADGDCTPLTGQGGIPGGGPPGLGAGPTDSWGYQSCTENLHEFSGRGFRSFTFELEKVNEVCMAQYGVVPRPGWPRVQYGGYEINSKHSTITNVIWSNGLLDPWHGGGFLESHVESCPVFIMPNGAHHVDLRANHPDDTSDITETRQKEKEIIRRWIEEAVRE